MIEILIAFAFKHFLADYVFNPGFEKNKYLGLGGLKHLWIHLSFSVICLGIVGLPWQTILLATLINDAVHYHIDYIKSRYRHYRLPRQHLDINYDRDMRIVTGLDQLAHIMTYIAVAYYVS